ncbi:MAG: hypothetical protein HYZ72_10205 [Deltaproteobacteria bacterium]|nr:hypothetical protein [Deltaproteobacteria bacterium]
MKTSPWFVATVISGVLLFVPDRTALAQDLRAGVGRLADEIVKSMPQQQDPLRVAVADFPDLQNVTSDLGRYIANRLTTSLTQSPKFFVVERQRLGQVLAELKFSISDLVDPTKAKQLGQMVGVEAIVVGTVSDLGNQVDVDVRIIEIETTRTLLSATTTISKDQVVSQLLERGREAPVASPSARTPTDTPSRSQQTGAPPAIKYQEFPKFRVEIEQLQIMGDGTITMFLAYINKTQEELLIGLCRASHANTFLVDSAGNHYRLRQSSGIGELCDRTGRRERPLTVGLGMKATASFTFRKDKEREQVGENFSFTSEQIIVRSTAERGYKTESTHNISIRDLQAR